MNEPWRQTYLLVGTVTKDLLPDGDFTIGGTVTYASTMAKSLGWQPLIVTRAPADFKPPAHLADLEWRILPTPEITTFRNVYYPQGRVQTIGPIAASIRKRDIPPDCRQAAIAHLCPLAQDVEPAVASIFADSLLIATPQGWLRQWDEQGIVSLGQWQEMEQTLPQFQMAVFSIEDVEGDWNIIERWIKQSPLLIVTEGEHGCTVFQHGEAQKVPPRPANPTDLTGAGDVFAAAFAIRFQETSDLWVSARFANVAASMAIERPGAQGVPTRAEIEAYLALNP
jgi:sugar/nucleoside kinase (ribokinase family)